MFVPGDCAKPDRNVFDWLSMLRFLERLADEGDAAFDAAKNIHLNKSFNVVSLS